MTLQVVRLRSTEAVRMQSTSLINQWTLGLLTDALMNSVENHRVVERLTSDLVAEVKNQRIPNEIAEAFIQAANRNNFPQRLFSELVQAVKDGNLPEILSQNLIQQIKEHRIIENSAREMAISAVNQISKKLVVPVLLIAGLSALPAGIITATYAQEYVVQFCSNELSAELKNKHLCERLTNLIPVLIDGGVILAANSATCIISTAVGAFFSSGKNMS